MMPMEFNKHTSKGTYGRCVSISPGTIQDTMVVFVHLNSV